MITRLDQIDVVRDVLCSSQGDEWRCKTEALISQSVDLIRLLLLAAAAVDR